MGFGVWVWGLGFGVWGLGFGVWGLGFGVWGLGFGVWGLGFGVWGLGFGVWGLGFGVWGLGFGVWGLGLGAHEVLPRLGFRLGVEALGLRFWGFGHLFFQTRTILSLALRDPNRECLASYLGTLGPKYIILRCRGTLRVCTESTVKSMLEHPSSQLIHLGAGVWDVCVSVRAVALVARQPYYNKGTLFWVRDFIRKTRTPKKRSKGYHWATKSLATRRPSRSP